MRDLSSALIPCYAYLRTKVNNWCHFLQYYLSYLTHLQVGELRTALFDLHRYFDYKKWDDDQISSETERTSLEKHQFKFKRFRYCALNLGVFHFHHEHYEISFAALEEAIRMAQETNDSHCLLHAMVSPYLHALLIVLSMILFCVDWQFYTSFQYVNHVVDRTLS